MISEANWCGKVQSQNLDILDKELKNKIEMIKE